MLRLAKRTLGDGQIVGRIPGLPPVGGEGKIDVSIAVVCVRIVSDIKLCPGAEKTGILFPIIDCVLG
jgi:hypothetical protein